MEPKNRTILWSRLGGLRLTRIRINLLKNQEIRRAALFWVGTIGLILTAIGNVSALNILSGFVLWIAENWRYIYQFPFYLIEIGFVINIPNIIADIFALIFFSSSIILGLNRTKIDFIDIEYKMFIDATIMKTKEIKAELLGKKYWGPKVGSEFAPVSDQARIFSAVLVSSIFSLNTALIFVNSVPLFIEIMVTVLVFFSAFVLLIGSYPKWSDVQAMWRVSSVFWIGFLALFLIGAYPWLGMVLSEGFKDFVDFVEIQKQ